MPEDYEMEEFADMAIGELREFIDTELQLVNEEHELSSKLMSWDYVIGHLDERIPANMTHLHALNGKITEKLVEIRALVESDRMRDLSIVKEEEETLLKLRADVKHRDWRAVKKDVKAEEKEEKRALRLEKRELRQLHSLFIDLMKLMKRSKLIEAIEEDLASEKGKEEYEKLEEYYFLQIYKFAKAYERIFRHLWEKELVLARKI
ncbi:hypothetical protein GOV06_03090 [Candidatus Woesearchaeota archaeon]|nr:hypothetical protein [Candidatus Woesearchaeota archaeon]